MSRLIRGEKDIPNITRTCIRVVSPLNPTRNWTAMQVHACNIRHVIYCASATPEITWLVSCECYHALAALGFHPTINLRFNSEITPLTRKPQPCPRQKIMEPATSFRTQKGFIPLIRNPPSRSIICCQAKQFGSA